SKNQRIASEVCPCCKTAVIANEGRVYVSWRQVLDGDHRHIAVASSTDGGRTFPPRTIVSDDNWQLSACPVSGAAMYARPGGELNVAWYTAGDAGQAGYYIAKTVDGGGTFGSRLFVGEGASGTPAIIPTNADPVLVMPGQDEQVTIARISDQGGSYDMQRGVLRGANPAAVFANGSIYITFVKKENNSGTVWLAKR
ncbi:MAG TPA: sialidase family protein, partial [Pyrinomonadaceae bacterium]|nr:sialidase family protein [Pyrinomonadaceae bacterium]